MIYQVAIYGALLFMISRGVSHFTRRKLKVVAFFHPYAAGRGGGERVLWAAISGILNRIGKTEDVKIVIYSIDLDRETILAQRSVTFGLKPHEFDSRIEFRKIYFSTLLEPRFWRFATILGQSVGSAFVLLCSLLLTSLAEWPTIFIDSTGFPFTLPVAKLLTGARTCAYIHYPTMSNNMVSKVSGGTADFNNSTIFVSNALLQTLKLLYYKLFLRLYKISGSFVDVAVCNSEWTRERIRSTWSRDQISVLYPPAVSNPIVQTHALRDTENARKMAIVSLAQFRAEKKQDTQLRVFRRLLDVFPDCEFWMMGGCRNKRDKALVTFLEKLAFHELGIPRNKIQFLINFDKAEVDKRLRSAKCAIHTMVDEHFGISLLEFLEAKTPIVCHRSGGPKSDIILKDEKYGYLASSEQEFVDKIANVLKTFDSAEITQKRIEGYNSLARFPTDRRFGELFWEMFIK
jgi:alpha-1,2-mannosyltransferase